MSTRIEVLWRQALKTFSGCDKAGYKLCQKNFDKLHGLMNNIVADDVKVDEKVLDHVEKNTAPMCVIDVFENHDITIAVFLLRKGVTLPLHDHPGMHGLLKVIHGTVRIDSFTRMNSLERMESQDQFTVEKHPSVIAQTTSPALILTPKVNNLHEITCLEGPAAFLDILSPPYKVDVDEDDVADRPCTFFKQVSSEETTPNDGLSTIVKLMVVRQPPNFYSESLKYLGQPLR